MITKENIGHGSVKTQRQITHILKSLPGWNTVVSAWLLHSEGGIQKAILLPLMEIETHNTTRELSVR
jgi:hypothetical protein